jgi:Stress responsive A/B Barrel Domain.
VTSLEKSFWKYRNNTADFRALRGHEFLRSFKLMKKQTRRIFLTTAVALTTTAAITAMPTMKPENKKQLTHHVFFWLKKRDSKEDLKKLIEGLKTLEKIESVRKLHIGVPASTEQRSVVDSSFSVSELMFFDDVAGQNIYQEHPIHKRFVEQCSDLWEKVIVYDTIAV